MTEHDGWASQVPPQNTEAEQSVLGGMLLSRKAIEDVIKVFDPADFYRPAHETIYNAIRDLHIAGEPADPITVAAHLRTAGDLDRIGGQSYLHTLAGKVPTASSAVYYAEIVRDCARLDRLQQELRQALVMVEKGEGGADEIASAVRSRIQDATEQGVSDGDRGGWSFTDLSAVLDGTHKPLVPTVGARDDGIGLFYPGRINGIQGESEAGKSWVAFIACLTEINRGNHVVYLDFEDDEEGAVSRMLLIGALPSDLRERFHYVRPDVTPRPMEIDAFIRLVEQAEPTLIVVDGVTEAMSLFGLELKDNTEIAKFGRRFLRPLADTGAAVVPLDHVVKNGESRGRYALGGVHKLNGVNGVQYTLEAVQPFGVNAEGRSRLRIAKDRPAQIRKHALPGSKGALHWFAEVVIKSAGDGFAEAHIYPPIQRADDPAEMTAEEDKAAKEEAEIKEREEAVIKALSKAAEPLSKTSVEELVPGRASITRRALTRLVHEGRVETTTGSRNAVLHSVPEGDGE